MLQVALPGKNPNGNDWMTIQTDISTVTLPASILNLTMCDIAILSGSFNGLHRILPIDDGVRNMSTNEPTRILSNLWYVNHALCVQLITPTYITDLCPNFDNVRTYIINLKW